MISTEEAIERYRKIQKPEDLHVEANEEERKRNDERVAEAVKEADFFLSSEGGRKALTLLHASGKEICMGKVDEGDRILINEEGFRRRPVTWEKSTEGLTTLAIIQFFRSIENDPKKFLPWLRKEIQKIADAAP